MSNRKCVIKKIASLNSIYNNVAPVLVGDKYEGTPSRLVRGGSFYLTDVVKYGWMATSTVVDYFIPPMLPKDLIESKELKSVIDENLDCDYFIKTMNSLYVVHGDVETIDQID